MERISQERFREELNRILVGIRRYRPQKVILFGSCARGDYHAFSDVDLLVVKQTDHPFLERIGELLSLCDASLPLEPLVYTEAELADMLSRGNTFLETALREGVVIYEDTSEGGYVKEENSESARGFPDDRNYAEASRWFRQSEYDLQAAALNNEHGFHAWSCFLCQQAAEKALKAFLYAQGERIVRGHATSDLLRQCMAYNPAFSALRDLCAELDQYYIPTRYPNGLPGGIPHEVYTTRQSSRALDDVSQVIDMVRAVLCFEEGESS
jgi:HEPN domain-containing protein/predicted nucleotidyltransferase